MTYRNYGSSIFAYVPVSVCVCLCHGHCLLCAGVLGCVNAHVFVWGPKNNLNYHSSNAINLGYLNQGLSLA